MSNSRDSVSRMKEVRVADTRARCAQDASGKKKQSWTGRLLAGVGISGAALAALCCAAPFLLAGLLTALGLGFILNDSILMGLLVAFAAMAALGYYLIERAKHC